MRLRQVLVGTSEKTQQAVRPRQASQAGNWLRATGNGCVTSVCQLITSMQAQVAGWSLSRCRPAARPQLEGEKGDDTEVRRATLCDPFGGIANGGRHAVGRAACAGWSRARTRRQLCRNSARRGALRPIGRRDRLVDERFARRSRFTGHAADPLRALAAKYSLSVNTLLWSNPKLVDKLNAGQEVVIPPVDGVLVKVATGDTIAALAQKYHAETDAIVQFNLLRHPEALPLDQYLMIPYGVGPEPPSAPQANAHTVNVGKRTWYVTPVWSSGGGIYPFGQCTWYVNTRRPAPWGGNAWQWYSRAKAYGRPVGPTPRVGAIMVTWESPYWGHVAYVEQVYADGSWLVSEMNYAGVNGGGWGKVSFRHVVPGTVPLIGFIY